MADNVVGSGHRQPSMVKLDAGLLQEARVLAADVIRERKAFDKARRRALTRLRRGLDLQWTRPKSRDELHGR